MQQEQEEEQKHLAKRQKLELTPTLQQAQEAQQEAQPKKKIVDAYLCCKPFDHIIPKGAKKETVVTNFFALDIGLNNATIFCYSVTFECPVELYDRKKYILIQSIKKELPQSSIYTGSNLYTTKAITQSTFSTIAKFKEPAPVTITFKLVEEYSQGTKITQDLLALFNHVVNKVLTRRLDMVQHGPYHFFKEGKPVYNYRLLPGFSTSIQISEKGSYIVSDFKQKIISTQSVIGLIRNRQETENRLVNSVVLTTYNKRPYRITGIAWEENINSTFKVYDRKEKKYIEISYIDYFKTKGVSLKETKFPLLKAKVRLRGQKKQEIRLPPEQCILTGIDKFELSRMRSALVKSPKDRLYEITKFTHDLAQNTNAQQDLVKWGMSVSPKVEHVDSYILPAETLQFGHPQVHPVKNGEWKNVWKDKFQVKTPAAVKQWNVVCPRYFMSQADALISNIISVAKPLNVYIPNPRPILECRSESASDYLNTLQRNDAEIKQASFVLVILPEKGNELAYSAVKNYLCTHVPVLSQCVLVKNIDAKQKWSIATNIAIQIQAKLSGVPWKLRMPFEGKPESCLMVVGIHENINQKVSSDTVSGGFCASQNDTCTSYYSKMFAKVPRAALAGTLIKYLTQAVEKLKEKIGVYPASVLVYRDGISDGAINKLFEKDGEITLFSNYLKSMSIYLMYVSVNKKVAAKYFIPGESRNNVPCGTVVKDTVTSSYKSEFYMCSTQCGQGTANPVRYQLLADNLRVAENILVKMTYSLCHYYFNWCGTVRVPAPLMYATTCAKFAGFIEGENVNESLDSKLYYL